MVKCTAISCLSTLSPYISFYSYLVLPGGASPSPTLSYRPRFALQKLSLRSGEGFCRDLDGGGGIEVIELQHGTITDYHLGYSYPEKTRLNGDIPYFPDKILSFGDYWMNEDTSPIPMDNVIPIGFSYFEEQSKDFIGLDAVENQILFISQGVIGKYLSQLAFEFAKTQRDLKIIYKLHPGEYETWKENYPQLVEASSFDNFEVIDNSEIPLYNLLAKSNCQVGAFSTAIYEGLMFNCKTFILDVPGIEYLDDLIDGKYVFKIGNADDLIDNLDDFKPTYYDKDFFFKNLDKNLLKSVIDNG